MEKGLISWEISPFFAMAPRSRLSAKLFSVPFWFFNDSYQEKHTYNKLFHIKNVKIALNWYKLPNFYIKSIISRILYADITSLTI